MRLIYRPSTWVLLLGIPLLGVCLLLKGQAPVPPPGTNGAGEEDVKSAESLAPKLSGAQRIELLTAQLAAEKAKVAALQSFAQKAQAFLSDPELMALNVDRDRAVAAATAKRAELAKSVCGEQALKDDGTCEPKAVSTGESK